MVDNVNLIGIELALVLNSFSVQGEFVNSKVDAESGSVSFPTFYGQVSYFLTGESRVYKGGYDGFDRVKPTNNLGDGGFGAWEISARYSRVDFTDQLLLGGEMSGITVGLNWYLNPVSRILLNYAIEDLQDFGTTNIFQTRFQIDF